MSNTATYRHTHRELFRSATKRWREKLNDPNYARNSLAKFRKRNPSYHIEWRARVKLRKAWLAWTRVLAISRMTPSHRKAGAV